MTTHSPKDQMSADELLARSLAMEDYMDSYNTANLPTDISPPVVLTTNSNSASGSTKKPKCSKHSSDNGPEILNAQCLPAVLANYVASNKHIDLSDDIGAVNPDAHQLFQKYNYLFFDSKLSGCELKWSKRMTLCAGLCCYEGHGGLCSIKLSCPLLKYRPTKDTVETLIHEMIHAYLFVTVRDRDRDGHGDRFKTLMNVINWVCSANQLGISIYHTFHDEVDACRKHVWKCNGPCQKLSPYFGIVKRAMNRVPGPNDTWWARHLKSCGGSYTKISEPKEFTEKQQKKKERAERKRLRELEKATGKVKPKAKKKSNAKTKTCAKIKDEESITKYTKDATCANTSITKDEESGPTATVSATAKGAKDGKLSGKKRKRDQMSLADMFERKMGLKQSDNADSDIELLTLGNTNKKRRKVAEIKIKIKKLQCPVCQHMIEETVLNEHLDGCLS